MHARMGSCRLARQQPPNGSPASSPAHAWTQAATLDVEDLEVDASPEEIMLSYVSGDKTKVGGLGRPTALGTPGSGGLRVRRASLPCCANACMCSMRVLAHPTRACTRQHLTPQQENGPSSAASSAAR